jgi:hypothetical protein
MAKLDGGTEHITALRDFCEFLWGLSDTIQARAEIVGLSGFPEACKGLGDSPDADRACEAYGDLQIALTDCALMVDVLTDHLELVNDPVVRDWQGRRDMLSTELPTSRDMWQNDQQ